jgi:hypothetical protein
MSLTSHPVVMLIPSPPSDPEGNSASAGFAHCKQSQRVPHLDQAWTHQISFFNLSADLKLGELSENVVSGM